MLFRALYFSVMFLVFAVAANDFGKQNQHMMFCFPRGNYHLKKNLVVDYSTFFQNHIYYISLENYLRKLFYNLSLYRNGKFSVIQKVLKEEFDLCFNSQKSIDSFHTFSYSVLQEEMKGGERNMPFSSSWESGR